MGRKVDPKDVARVLALPRDERARQMLCERFGWTRRHAIAVLTALPPDQRSPRGASPKQRNTAIDLEHVLDLPIAKRHLRHVRQVLHCDYIHANRVLDLLPLHERPTSLLRALAALPIETMTILDIARATGASVSNAMHMLKVMRRQWFVPAPPPQVSPRDIAAPVLMSEPAGTCPVSGLPVRRKRFLPGWVEAARRKPGLIARPLNPAQAFDARFSADMTPHPLNAAAHLSALLALVALEGGGFADVVPPASDRRMRVMIALNRAPDPQFSSAGSPAAMCVGA